MATQQSDTQALKSAIQSNWSGNPSGKAKPYTGAFFGQMRTRRKIVAKVQGNYGTYTVSIEATAKGIQSACSCPIGKNGFCHHCEALAFTFLQEEALFAVTPQKAPQQVRTGDDVKAFLRTNTLASLIENLKTQGMTQKEFAEIVGINPQRLAAVKSSELRNRFFNELGAMKLACLWLTEHRKKNAFAGKNGRLQ